MNIGAASPASTSPFVDNKYVSSSTAPYQASPTNSTASNLPLTQEVGGGTDHTFTASTTDHELNAVNAPNPLGTSSPQPPLYTSPQTNTQPDTLAQSGIGILVSSAQ
jgi:hypothetical protein